MLKPIAIFFIVYFLISAIVYADTRVNLPCELERMGMMDNDKRNPGCDKGELDEYLKELFKPKEQYDI
jgi:hypothetical protein